MQLNLANSGSRAGAELQRLNEERKCGWFNAHYACYRIVADTPFKRDRTINASSGGRSECRCVSAERLGFWSVALPDGRRNDSNKISQREKDHMDNAPAITISVDQIWTAGFCQSKPIDPCSETECIDPLGISFCGIVRIHFRVPQGCLLQRPEDKRIPGKDAMVAKERVRRVGGEVFLAGRKVRDNIKFRP